MLDHVTVGVADIERSRAFYNRVLETIGIERLYAEGEAFAGYGSGGKAFFWIGQRSGAITGTHVAFAVGDRAAVERFHAAALAAGGRDNGGPGLRPRYHPNYYGTFVLDPDGHNIEAVCHAPGNGNREQAPSAAAPRSQQVARAEEEHGTKGMRQALHHLTVMTSGQGLFEATEPVRRWVAAQGIGTGVLTVWCRHTSASLLVQANADSEVKADLEAFFVRLAPEGRGLDNMPAHLRAALTAVQVVVPVEAGARVFGEFQELYVFEHRGGEHRRELVLHLIGEA